MDRHRSATQQHHLQSKAWTSHQLALSVGGNRQCETSFVAQVHRSESASRHLFWQAPQRPCPVWKRFRRDHCHRGRSSKWCICNGVFVSTCVMYVQTSVASYIRLFEPLVIKSLKQYTVTSQVALQQQVLDLLAQLVQLRVNYCLLDSDQVRLYFVTSN